MNCFTHVDVPAVARCTECGRGLCKDCANVYDPPVCEGCFSKAESLQRTDSRKQLLVASALFVSGAFLGFGMAPTFMTAIMAGLMLAGIPTGWRTLTNLTPRIFLWLPLMGWVLYFVFKFSAACVIGPFILPFKLGGWSAGLLHQRRLRMAIPSLYYLLLIIGAVLEPHSQARSLHPVSGMPAQHIRSAPSSPAAVHSVPPPAIAPVSDENWRERQLLESAQKYYSHQLFDEALSAVNEALVLNANDPEAISLKHKIVDAQNVQPRTLGPKDNGASVTVPERSSSLPYAVTPVGPKGGDVGRYSISIQQCIRKGDAIDCVGIVRSTTDYRQAISFGDVKAIDDEGTTFVDLRYSFSGSGSGAALYPGVPVRFELFVPDPDRNVKAINIVLKTKYDPGNDDADQFFPMVPVQ